MTASVFTVVCDYDLCHIPYSALVALFCWHVTTTERCAVFCVSVKPVFASVAYIQCFNSVSNNCLLSVKQDN